MQTATTTETTTIRFTAGDTLCGDLPRAEHLSAARAYVQAFEELLEADARVLRYELAIERRGNAGVAGVSEIIVWGDGLDHSDTHDVLAARAWQTA